jgi:hypothetical protein
MFRYLKSILEQKGINAEIKKEKVFLDGNIKLLFEDKEIVEKTYFNINEENISFPKRLMKNMIYLLIPKWYEKEDYIFKIDDPKISKTPFYHFVEVLPNREIIVKKQNLNNDFKIYQESPIMLPNTKFIPLRIILNEWDNKKHYRIKYNVSMLPFKGEEVEITKGILAQPSEGIVVENNGDKCLVNVDGVKLNLPLKSLTIKESKSDYIKNQYLNNKIVIYKYNGDFYTLTTLIHQDPKMYAFVSFSGRTFIGGASKNIEEIIDNKDIDNYFVFNTTDEYKGWLKRRL